MLSFRGHRIIHLSPIHLGGYRYRYRYYNSSTGDSFGPVVFEMWSMEFLLLALLALFLFCLYDCRKPRKFPPGPFWFPFVGCLPQYQLLRRKYGYVHKAFQEFTKDYGPILGVKLGQKKFVVISSHKLVKKVLLTDDFNGRPDGFFFRVRSWGKKRGILFTDGTTWSQNRRLTAKHFRSFGFGQPAMQEEVAREARFLVEHLQEVGKGEKPIPMESAFDVAVLNALWTMLAGHRYPYDDPRLPEVLRTVHDTFKVCDTLGGVVSQVPFLRHVIPDQCGYNRLMAVLQRLWKFIGDEVDKREAKMRREIQKPMDLMDAFVLEMISSEKDSDTQSFDRQEIIITCLDLFLAGSKTTTDALSMTFAYLGQHPEWQKLLQDDLDSVVGRDRDPVLEDAVHLPRVEAFLTEAQRFLILTPLGVPHNTLKDVTFEGYEIPKDTTILINFYSAHNDANAWHKPNEFLPERFLDENGQFNKKHDYMQFGLGKRRCLGEQLARASLFLYFTYVVHHFDMKVSEKHGPPPLDGVEGFVLSPKPYHLILTPRSTRK